MKIHSIALPTPFPVGDVNVYLIVDEPLTLIDTGPKTPEALAALEAGLRQHKFVLADIKRILLTHTHEDHCGLVRTIQDRAKNVEIWVHDWESDNLLHGRDEKSDYDKLLFKAGVPESVKNNLQSFFDSFGSYSDKLENRNVTSLIDNAEIEFASGSLRAIDTPGHTPGHVAFVREANRTIIAGDCVLKRITPNPILAVDPLRRDKRFQSLGEYLVSLARLRSLAPTLIYGGHGEPITDYEELFHRYVRLIDERQTRVLDLIGSHSLTAWQVAEKLFPAAINVNVHQFLAISEASAHLDYAFENGKVRLELQNGAEYYRKQ